MEFRILGPLEVSSGKQAVPLGGFKQRAALGLLLLRANRVVATSEMLGALWPEEDLPVTARKIVQNAVWGLRAILADLPDDPGSGPVERPELLTQAPGYTLRLDPERLDVNRFDRQVAEGRARLVAGDPERAAVLLRAALNEWRGPALADLVEHGVDWPELTALRQHRLDVMEDRFEAELASGHHQEVLGELVSLVAAEPLRERLCRQLMVALYRCGRQAEALSVFTRVRRALVEEYGLEPSRDLQLLQQRILTHEPSLAAPAETGPERQILATVRPLYDAPLREAVLPVDDDHLPLDDERLQVRPRVPAQERQREETFPWPERPAGQKQSQSAGCSGGPVAERRQVSIVLVRVGFADEQATLAGDRSALSLHDTVSAFTEGVEESGGTVVGSLGYVSVALFGLRGDPAAASPDAVAAALALRDRFHRMQGPTFHAVVIAGVALVRHDPRDPTAPVTVAGRLLDDAHTLLTAVPPGEVYVSAEARVTEVRRRHRPVADLEADLEVARRRTQRETSDRPFAPQDEPAGHERALTALTDLLYRSRRHEAPHLVTVLGEEGVGKTRLLEDFELRVSLRSPQVRIVRVGAAEDGGNGPQLARDILAECCGLPPGAGSDSRFTEAVHRLAGHPATADRLLHSLHPLMGPAARATSHQEVHDSWIELVTLSARDRPLILCFDDMHRAGDDVLDCVERLVSTAGSVPLFVAASARPDLLERRPYWGSGQGHTGVLTLGRLHGPREDLRLRFGGLGPDDETVPTVGNVHQESRWGRAFGGHEPSAARHAER
ncbi:BTAD domain-containing putative transcriptional regulator [Streptomyces sp. NPDC127119]|uniref:BTAD domain-containing putative transcriptional regulator n=1 Tax=Streptomyces sp. NPDC127119 TaxID=3345370 RepID=UPI0036250144